VAAGHHLHRIRHLPGHPAADGRHDLRDRHRFRTDPTPADRSGRRPVSQATFERTPGATHPAFKTPLSKRLLPPLVTALLAAALVKMAIDVAFVPARFLAGLDKAGALLWSMFPPSPGGQFLHILHALGETLAMAFVGTVLGALLALPFGIIGAKTV